MYYEISVTNIYKTWVTISYWNKTASSCSCSICRVPSGRVRMIAFYNFLSFLALLNLSSVKCFFKDRLDYGDGKSGFEILAFNLEAAPAQNMQIRMYVLIKTNINEMKPLLKSQFSFFNRFIFIFIYFLHNRS